MSLRVAFIGCVGSSHAMASGLARLSHARGFDPNLFVDINPRFDGKVAAMRLYDGKMGSPPFPAAAFPRSVEAVRAQAGGVAAEVFMSTREIQ